MAENSDQSVCSCSFVLTFSSYTLPSGEFNLTYTQIYKKQHHHGGMSAFTAQLHGLQPMICTIRVPTLRDLMYNLSANTA